jgi:hypothetical protein
VNVTTIPQPLKNRFVIIDGFYVEPHRIHSQDSRGVTLLDGRRFDR